MYLENNLCNNLYEIFVEQNENLTNEQATENKILNPQFANRSSLSVLLCKYENIFAQSKYDIGHI